MNISNKDKIQNEISNNISYDNIKSKDRIYYRSDNEPNKEEINDNLSEKANSVQTSYKYHKNKKGPNTLSSKDNIEINNNYHYHNNYNDYDDSVEMSENDNLICPNCINCTLIEEKRRRENLNDMRDMRQNEEEKENTNALIDKNRNYNMDLIDEKRRQRERNQNNAYQNLAKIKAGMSNKDKLIQQNENSRNPLNEGYPDYQYQKFQDEYARRQKMINENINKYYPNMNKERPEISSYYNNYVNNPNYERDKNNYNNNKIYDEREREKDYDQFRRSDDKKEYLRILEEQINYKNELKRREKEEDRRRGQKQYEDMQRELKREEQERYMKEQRQKEELIRGNLELINQKNQLKIKELEEKLRYRDLCDKQNEDYIKELERQKNGKRKIKR
jgi:hypothetical protein